MNTPCNLSIAGEGFELGLRRVRRCLIDRGSLGGMMVMDCLLPVPTMRMLLVNAGKKARNSGSRVAVLLLNLPHS